MKKTLLVLMAILFCCGRPAVAAPPAPLNQEAQTRRVMANMSVVLKMLTRYEPGSEITIAEGVTTADRETYLIGGSRGVVYYLANAFDAAKKAGGPPTGVDVGLIFIPWPTQFISEFVAAAMDLATQEQAKLLKSVAALEQLTGSAKAQALEKLGMESENDVSALAEKMGELADEKLNALSLSQDTLNTAVRIFVRSELTLGDFAYKAAAMPGGHYAKLRPDIAATVDPAAAAAAAAATATAVVAAALNEALLANNGLNAAGQPASVPNTTVLPALATPAGAVIAYGDGGFPVVAGALDSNPTFSTAGGLTAFSMGSGMDTGSNATPGVCAIAACTEPAVVRWGAWSSGSASISGQNSPISALTQLHYLVGTATTPAQYATLTGIAVPYAPVGGTIATGTNGQTYTATMGNINVNFTASSATLTSYALSGGGLVAADYTFINVPLTISTSLSGPAKVISGTRTNAASNTLSANGFVAGATGNYLGMGFKTSNAANTVNINQVQAFRR